MCVGVYVSVSVCLLLSLYRHGSKSNLFPYECGDDVNGVGDDDDCESGK